MDHPLNERRRSARHQLIVDLFFDGAEGIGIAQSRDVSLNGLYLSTQSRIPKGARLKLRLPIDLEAGDYLVLDGIVVYSQPRVGAAVEFEGLGAATEEKLAQFIQAEQERRAVDWEGVGTW